LGAEARDLGDRPERPVGRLDAGASCGAAGELPLESGGRADDQKPRGRAAAVGERVRDAAPREGE
jgi:hypothetical protein